MRGNHGIFAKKGQRMYPEFWRQLGADNPRHATWLARMDHFDILETPGVSGVTNTARL